MKKYRIGRSLAYRYAERLSRTRSMITGKLPTGSLIALSPCDHQHRAIFVYAEHEPEVTALLQRIICPGDVLFDVGANVGYYALLARDLGAKVHAFEPNPDVRALLERTLAWNDVGVTLDSRAVSRSSGQNLPFYISEPGNTGMSSLERPTDRQVDAQTITLDDYIADTGVSPDIVKLDVEGHQRAVLEGAAKLLSSRQCSFIVETETQSDVAPLEAHGYEPHYILNDGSLERLTWPLPSLSTFANLFFRSPGPSRAARGATRESPRAGPSVTELCSGSSARPP